MMLSQNPSPKANDKFNIMRDIFHVNLFCTLFVYFHFNWNTCQIIPALGVSVKYLQRK